MESLSESELLETLARCGLDGAELRQISAEGTDPLPTLFTVRASVCSSFSPAVSNCCCCHVCV
jgi:hypothetical protein